MLKVLLAVLVAVVVVLVAVGLVYVVGMRRKSPAVVRAVRGFSRSVVNPRMLKTAGTPGAYASVVEHVGRRTGRAYRTPVVAEPTDDGFVIALPYGTTSNWVRNVLAADSATIVHEGGTYEVDQPELVPMDGVAHWFPEKDRRAHARFKVDRCVQLRRVDGDAPATRIAEATPGADAERP